MSAELQVQTFSKGKRATGGSPIAKDMGKRIRALRASNGWSMDKCANRIGVTWQQWQKYESGVNNLSVPRLLQVCELFGVDWSHFLDPRPETAPTFAPRYRTTIEIIQAFEAISDAQQRRLVISLAESLADKQ